MRVSGTSFASLLLVAVGTAACHAPHLVAKVPYEPAMASTTDKATIAFTTNSPMLASDDSTSTLRDLGETRAYRLGVPHDFAFAKDDAAVYFLRSASGRDPSQSIYRVVLPEGREELVLAPGDLLKGPETLSAEERARRERLRIGAGGFTGFRLAPDGKSLAVELSGKLFLHDLTARTTRELAPGTSLYDARFSPDGHALAFVRDFNVHRIDLASGKVSAVTKGGTEEKPLGLADFAAQEELDRIEGWWWGPSADRILVEEVDQHEVERLAIVDPAHPEREPDRPFYPRAGHKNAVLGLALHDVDGKQPTRHVTWDKGTFPYLAKVTWTKELGLLLSVFDRPQKRLALLRVDEATGQTTPVLDEHDAAWVNHDPSIPAPVPGSANFLWASERSGHWQLELRDRSGAVVRVLTQPSHGYGATVRVTATHAFVSASPDPVDDVLLKVALDGTRLDELGKVDGRRQVSSTVSSTGAYLVRATATASSFATVVTVRNASDQVVATVSSKQETPKHTPAPTFHSVGAEGYRVAVLRPTGFVSGRTYPVIDAAYGGPHAQVVQAGLGGYARAQWMADATGAIVVAVDAKGTPARGRLWERAIEGDFGTLPIEGHVEALKALAREVPELDLDRVGVYGWSFGGYFAARAVLARSDFYKAAVAGAPPVDWLDYDTAYTERYLGVPDPAVPHPAYERSSLVPLAKRPLGPGETARPLLVVHGTADDNVHFKNSLVLADAMLRGGRPFELVPLVGTTHMLNDPALAIPTWSRMAAFLRTHLSTGFSR
jgi:dipeptidyl-peptidase-4